MTQHCDASCPCPIRRQLEAFFNFKLGEPHLKVPAKDFIHHPHRRIQRPGDPWVVEARDFTRKVEAPTSGGLHDICKECANLPGAKWA
jgi:hypothetical protein